MRLEMILLNDLFVASMQIFKQFVIVLKVFGFYRISKLLPHHHFHFVSCLCISKLLPHHHFHFVSCLWPKPTNPQSLQLMLQQIYRQPTTETLPTLIFQIQHTLNPMQSNKMNPGIVCIPAGLSKNAIRNKLCLMNQKNVINTDSRSDTKLNGVSSCCCTG